MEILVVMPDETSAERIFKGIREQGHTVMLTGTIAGAVDRISRHPVDLSFIHLCLPGGKGLALIGHMKKCFPEIPVVAMTNSNSRLLEFSARKLGVIYYMVEPFESDEIETIVNHLSRKDKYLQEGTDNAAATCKL